MTDPAPAYATAIEQLRARAEAAEKEREAIKAAAVAQLEKVTAERDQLQREVTSLSTKLTVVTAEVDHWRAKHAPRTPTDLEMQTGPVAFERDQLRHENLKLREEVATLAAELDGTRSRLTMATRDLDAAERAVATLKTFAHAIVNAVATETP